MALADLTDELLVGRATLIVSSCSKSARGDDVFIVLSDVVPARENEIVYAHNSLAHVRK